MVYCGSALIKILSGIVYSQLGFADEAGYGGFMSGSLIPQAQKIIDTFCNHNFNDNLGTFSLDGRGKKVLVMPPKYSPLRSAGTVTLDGVDVSSSIKTYDQYIVYDDGVFTEDEQNVSVVASYGYTSVPADVELVCGQICANALREIVRSKMMPDLIAPILEAGGGGVGGLLASPRIFTGELKDLLRKYVFIQMEVG